MGVPLASRVEASARLWRPTRCQTGAGCLSGGVVVTVDARLLHAPAQQHEMNLNLRSKTLLMTRFVFFG